MPSSLFFFWTLSLDHLNRRSWAGLSIFGGLQEYRRSKRPAILTMPFPKWPPPFFEVETRPQHPRWRAFLCIACAWRSQQNNIQDHLYCNMLHAGNQMERYGRVKTCLLDFCNSSKRVCYSDCKLAAHCLGLLSGACTARRRGLGDTGRPDSPLARGKTRNVARQTWKCRPSKPKMSPAKIESNSLKTHQNKGFCKKCPKSVGRRCRFWRTPKRLSVGRRFPLEMPTLTWRLPLWVIRHSYLEKHFFTWPHHADHNLCLPHVEHSNQA